MLSIKLRLVLLLLPVSGCVGIEQAVVLLLLKPAPAVGSLHRPPGGALPLLSLMLVLLLQYLVLVLLKDLIVVLLQGLAVMVLRYLTVMLSTGELLLRGKSGRPNFFLLEDS